MPLQKLKAFTWGYYGWGSSSKEFVRAADAFEKERGFSPPVFVDLRVSRSVRAANFNNSTFEKIVGTPRYVWEPRLGNKRILDKQNGIEIADPSAARDLLDRIIDLDSRGSRAILFCWCLRPLNDGMIACHRVEVADLLINAAEKRGMQIFVAEWPGEKPNSLHVRPNAQQEILLQKRARYIPIGSVDGDLPALAMLGWGSDITFEMPHSLQSIITGPAHVRKAQWMLEVLGEPPGPERRQIVDCSEAFRRQNGYGANFRERRVVAI